MIYNLFPSEDNNEDEDNDNDFDDDDGEDKSEEYSWKEMKIIHKIWRR